MNVGKTNDAEMKFVSCLVHGNSGAGKTTSIKTLPEDVTLIVGVERNLLPLRHNSYNLVTLENWEDVLTLQTSLALAGQKPAKDGSLTITVGGMTFKGIKILVIDSLTEMNEFCRDYIKRVDRKELVEGRYGEGVVNPKGVYKENLTQEDYGLLRERMSMYMSVFNQLPLHTIWTANSAWREDKNTGITTRVPGLNGDLATGCAKFFKVVIHMESDDEGNKTWCTAETPVAFAKDSSGALKMYEPTKGEGGGWMNIFKKILVQQPKPEQEK